MFDEGSLCRDPSTGAIRLMLAQAQGGRLAQMIELD
jgi:hypothetical protein